MTRWLFSDARERVICPRCLAAVGQPCQTPRGRKVDPPHVARITALRNQPDFNLADYRGQAINLGELLRKTIQATEPAPARKGREL